MATVKGISKSTTPTQERKILDSERVSNIPPHIWEAAKEELKPVKGRFRLYEKGRDGGSEKITFRKYPTEICPMFQKVMRDGEIYEIPLYAARFINGFDSNAKSINGQIHSCSIAKHGFKMSHPGDLKPSEDGMTEGGVAPVPVPGISKYERRMGFESLEFSGDVA